MKRYFPKPADRIMVVYIVLVLILGVLIVPDYGEPWDHLLRYRSGWTTVEIYRNPLVARQDADFGPSDSRYYGPFMVASANLFSRLLHGLGCGWDVLTSQRYAYYLVFQLGVLAFYYLCKYLVSDWAALTAALLFGTQPLLFGNAAANAKDTPFTALFIIALLAGLRMVDSLRGEAPTQPSTRGGLKQPWRADWQVIPARQKRTLLISGLVWLALLVVFLLLREQLVLAASNLVTTLYQAPAGSFAARLFDRFAANRDAAALESYQTKGILLAGRLVVLFLIVTLVVWLTAVLCCLPKTRKTLSGYTPATLKNRRIPLAGVALGLATSVRVLGPAAGGLVLLVYLFDKGVRKSLWPLVYYGLTAALTTTLTWPYLWPAPFKHFYESLTLMSSFPHLGLVLFNGQLYPSDQLPPSYMPVLMSIQFTEPVMVLALLGMVVAVAWWLERRQVKMTCPPLWLAAALWLLLPLGMILLKHPTIYDNFRQFFFITPPLFIFAAAALQAAYKGLYSKWMRVALALMVLLPGLYHIFKAHPYEYVYYNSYVGGVRGAIDRYHMDYLGLSVKEAVEYLNENAEPNATVLINGPYYEARYFLRNDLKLIDARDHPGIGERMPDATWIILNLYRQSDLDNPDMLDLFTVKLDGAELVVVRKTVVSSQ